MGHMHGLDIKALYYETAIRAGPVRFPRQCIGRGFRLECTYGAGRLTDKGIFDGTITSVGFSQKEGLLFGISLRFLGEDEIKNVSFNVSEDGDEWVLHFRNSGTHVSPHKIPIKFKISSNV